MRVFVTGGTGFVGTHAVAAMVAEGHAVRVLARDPAAAASGALGALGDGVEVVQGDVLDAGSIAAAVAGCDAAVHAAAAIGITAAGGPSVHEQNVTGTANVVAAALAAGCDPVVHVSSVAVFVPPREPVVTADSPLAAPRNEYGRSKVDAERWVRARQDEGAPVTIVYPGGVLGPDQPRLDAALEGLAAARVKGWPMAPGGMGIVDVRDLASVLAALLVPEQGPRRFVLGGHFVSWPALGELTDDICGVRARRMPLPRPLLIGTGAVLDVVRRFVKLDYPLTRDAAEIMAGTVPTDDAPVLAATGVSLRPARETLADALRWMVSAGHLPAKAAPALVG